MKEGLDSKFPDDEILEKFELIFGELKKRSMENHKLATDNLEIYSKLRNKQLKKVFFEEARIYRSCAGEDERTIKRFQGTKTNYTNTKEDFEKDASRLLEGGASPEKLRILDTEFANFFNHLNENLSLFYQKISSRS